MAMALFTFLLCIGASIRIAQSSPCHAQCTYDRVTGKADCSSRNLDCIPVNYPDSLVMDLSHNNITILEPADFNRTFTRLVELYLDYNNISDVTPLMTSTEMESLKKLSVQHNAIVQLGYSCRLESLEDLSLDNNLINSLYDFPYCQRLRRFSADSNELQTFRVGTFGSSVFPSYVSLRFNRITYISVYIYRFVSSGNRTLLLDHNKISQLYIFRDVQIGLLSLSHNRVRYLEARTPGELILASNGLHELDNGFRLFERENSLMEKLDIRNNSFDSLIQPDWAEGLEILHADDNLLANLSSTTLQGFVNLTELHLANNRLLFISPSALSQLTMLQSLYLDDNALTSLLGGIFLSQAELVELSITNNQISVLHPDYFTGLDSLERLHLAGNRLLYVHSVMFRHMPRLTTIDFSQNELERFDITNCNLFSDLENVSLTENSLADISSILGHCESLIILDIRLNQIEVVPGDSLTGKNRALSRLELEGNPLQCDCRLTGLRDWLLNNPPSVFPRCQGPPRYSGAVITNLGVHDFSCSPPKVMIKENQLNVRVGRTATLLCTASGIPAPNITWLDPNDMVISDEGHGRFVISSDMTLLIISVQISDQGVYTCMARNTLGKMDRAVISLTVIQDLESSTSLAASVLPTMFLTLIVTFIVAVLVIFLRRRYRKGDQTNLTASGPPHPEPTVSFHHRKASHSDGGYVNKVNDDQCESATNRPGGEEVYEVPVRNTDPPQVYQELAQQNKDEEYEPVC
ncbi:leucine-rich repeats and immunoglobulin-like domains protein 2 isoform X2 [Acanthaster planci]|nr:leucine-rich repeats and immunoglobulin-like domains protein 2 isoform X2 [Acanthaster planci]XP_022105018.1 leucine-rich repeats and immunoglobulin-like domains protein 2 isoform X2 [Acanthaster planci]